MTYSISSHRNPVFKLPQQSAEQTVKPDLQINSGSNELRSDISMGPHVSMMNFFNPVRSQIVNLSDTQVIENPEYKSKIKSELNLDPSRIRGKVDDYKVLYDGLKNCLPTNWDEMKEGVGVSSIQTNQAQDGLNKALMTAMLHKDDSTGCALSDLGAELQKVDGTRMQDKDYKVLYFTQREERFLTEDEIEMLLLIDCKKDGGWLSPIMKNAAVKAAILAASGVLGVMLKEAIFKAARHLGIRLQTLDLESVNLGQAHLPNAQLQRADLQEANLKDAVLTNANLRKAKLMKADLSGADLTGANLEGVDLTGANLNNAKLKGANLEGAVLNGTNLQGADLEDAIMDDVTY